MINNAARWLKRAKRSKEEKGAYMDGAFDAGANCADLKEIEELFK